MSIEQILLAVLGLSCTVLGWFARELYASTQKLREDLSEFQVHIARDYVRYDRLREVMQDAVKPIMESLLEIKQTLHGKADKP